MKRRTFVGSVPLGIAGTVIVAETSSAAALKGSSVTEPEKKIPVVDNTETIECGEPAVVTAPSRRRGIID